MRYIALFLFVLLLMSHGGCRGRGVQWTYDGTMHTFGWSGWK